MSELIWSSGPAEQLTNRGLQFGDGLFETLAVAHGRILRSELHLQRLRGGCDRLGLQFPEARVTELLARIQQAAGSRARAIAKLILTRAGPARGYRPDWAVPADVQATLFSADPVPAQPAPVMVRICRLRLARQPALAGLKHLNRLEQILARAEWQDPDIFEGLMLDAEGFVIEGTFSNLFYERQGRLYTPPLDQCGVAGVIRRFLLEGRFSGPVEERPLPLAELPTVEAAFICNSLIGIRGVSCIQFGDGPRQLAEGRHVALLQQALRQAEAV